MLASTLCIAQDVGMLITKREAADTLGVHPSTINRMISDGRIKPAQVIEGRARPVAAYLFRLSDVRRIRDRTARTHRAA